MHIGDSPDEAAFRASAADWLYDHGWAGITWPEEFGGHAGRSWPLPRWRSVARIGERVQR